MRGDQGAIVGRVGLTRSHSAGGREDIFVEGVAFIALKTSILANAVLAVGETVNTKPLSIFIVSSFTARWTVSSNARLTVQDRFILAQVEIDYDSLIHTRWAVSRARLTNLYSLSILPVTLIHVGFEGTKSSSFTLTASPEATGSHRAFPTFAERTR